MKKTVAVLLSAVMAVTVGALSLACGGGKDGINGVDGTNGVNGADGKSAYEIYKTAHPDYPGDEAQWVADSASGMLSDSYEYSVVSFGRNFSGTVTAGTVSSDGSTLALDSAVVKFNNDIIMPVTESSEWEIHIGGVLANGGESAELLASLDKSVAGRVYFGIYANNNIAYLGVNEGGYYFNYCWDVPGSTIKSQHEYTVRYRNGEYTLSVDGGDFKGFTKLNQNQADAVAVADAKVASAELNAKIKACNGQEYFTWTSIGADTHKVSCRLNYLDIETSSIYGYKKLSKHPLFGKTVYHLGSSISRGYSNGGISFADQIAELTGSKFVKEAVDGTTLSTAKNNSYVQRFDNFTFNDDPAFLILQLSTNDFSQNIQVGAVTDKDVTRGFDTTTMCGAIEHIIAQTKRYSPETEVLIYTCGIKQSWGARSRYAQFVNTTLKAIQSKWDIETVDLFNAKTVNTESWMADDIHPRGHQYANLFTPNMINVMIDALEK